MQVGVREYWIVDPMLKIVLVHLQEDGGYKGRAYGAAEVVPVTVLDGCVVNLAEVFGG